MDQNKHFCISLLGLFLLASVLAACVPGGGPVVACLDFDDLALGSSYSVPNTFTSGGATIQTHGFEWGNGGTTTGGFAEVYNGGLAGGPGNELMVNNINLAFDFGSSIDGLKLQFGEYGGNLNIEINGGFRNFDDFQDIHGATIGGVAVSVPTGGFGNDTGTLELSGEITDFIIGGQELFIDTVCPNP